LSVHPPPENLEKLVIVSCNIYHVYHTASCWIWLFVNGAEHQLDHQSVCKEHGHRIIIKHLNNKDSV
jgi:hypothetical protein